MSTKRLSKKTIAKIVEMREKGYGLRFIAKELNCSYGGAYWITLREGAEPPKQKLLMAPVPDIQRVVKRGNMLVKSFTAEEDEKLLELERKKLSRSDIARALKRQPNSITARLRTLARRDERQERLLTLQGEV